jgi:hypothetical protein
MNVCVNVLLFWFRIHVTSCMKHIVCNELSDVKTMSSDCLCMQQNTRTINSKDKNYKKKKCTRVNYICTSRHCYKLLFYVNDDDDDDDDDDDHWPQIAGEIIIGQWSSSVLQ